MPTLSAWEWFFAVLAALGIGISKSGFAGVSLVHVLVMAHIFGDRLSTGVVLPMLVVGDICAVVAFKRHAIWKHVARTLPIACIGVCHRLPCARLAWYTNSVPGWRSTNWRAGPPSQEGSADAPGRVVERSDCQLSISADQPSPETVRRSLGSWAG